MLIGALLRFPSEAIHRRLVADLNKAGFDDFRLSYIAVFQYPTPDGCRPSELAARAGISKQAMHRLLETLEELGYLTRSAAEGDGRARVVRFTQRGRAAWDKIQGILVHVEKDWRAALGDEKFELLKMLLYDVWRSDLVPSTSTS